jgi:uncharacterized protein
METGRRRLCRQRTARFAYKLRPWAIGMFGKRRIWRWLLGAAVLAAVEAACLLVVPMAVGTQAQAQVRDERYPFLRRHSHEGIFQNLFGGFNSQRYAPEEEQTHVDYSRAPPPPKTTGNTAPTTTIVVMGDGMAGWLAYGLEDAFSDTPGVAILRKDKLRSGLLRYDSKDDLDWWHVARDVLTEEKANYVVMMLGLNDRANMHEKDLAKEAEKQNSENGAAKGADAEPSIIAPEPTRPVNGVIEFRSDPWAKIYTRRIDETIAALKSKGVPVFWVGLPSIRGTKSTADAVYLNDLFRARAARAGINYIDVWDGFVDEQGKFSSYGPDYEGQTRRLRTPDGVFFTKYGARKLAHYVEREIRRYMSNRATPLAMPTGPQAPQPGGKSAVRPVAGPVFPLTVTTSNSDQLLGGGAGQQVFGDATANDVLVKGEPVNVTPGRADDFQWHPGAPAPAKPVSGEAVPASKTAIRQVEPTRAQEKAKEAQAASVAPTTAVSIKPAAPAETATVTVPVPEPRPDVAQRSAPHRRFSFPFNPLGWLR